MKPNYIDLRKIRLEAEFYYRNREFYCSEAILKTIKDAFIPNLPDDILALASGFPLGMGTGTCTCGALSGGVLSIGLIFGRSQASDAKVEYTMALSRELVDTFTYIHNTNVCNELLRGVTLGTEKHDDICTRFTGEVAVVTAKIICRELKVPTL